MADYTLTINVYYNTMGGGNNIVTPASGGSYPKGTVVQVTALPDTGYDFVYWTGSLTGTSNPQNITMNGNRTVNAFFGIHKTIALDVPIVDINHENYGILPPGHIINVPIVEIAHIENVNDLTNIGGAILHDNSPATDTNYTTQAIEDTANDVPLMVASPATNDGFYFLGSDMSLSNYIALILKIDTPGVGTWGITWYYWNGVTWSALLAYINSRTPGMADFKTENWNIMIFTGPSDWAMTTIAGKTGYALFAKITSFTSKTTIPLATRIYFIPNFILGFQGNWMGITF